MGLLLWFLLLFTIGHQLLSAMTVTQRRQQPKLIVFDLDNTLWTPELYQLRQQSIGPCRRPIADKDVCLFEGAATIIERIRAGKYDDVQFAVASRTKSVDWAFDLLKQFGLDKIFHYMEIFPANKDQHFANLAKISGHGYSDMLFFDDARDGRFGNCALVAKLGVLSVHCPQGIRTVHVFDRALDYYCNRWSGSPGVIIEHDGTVRERFHGVIKAVLSDKRYGFIRVVEKNDDNNDAKNDVFFHFRNLPPGQMAQKGDAVSFRKETDGQTDKTYAADIQFADRGAAATTTTDDSRTIVMPAFSMGMPFAALLTNGFKTIETRNGRMFLDYCPPGSKLLIHVGQKDYDDGDGHLVILKRSGLTNDDVRKLKTMPSGYGKGMVVAICEVGQSYEMSQQQRSDPAMENQIVAFGKDSGRIATEIRRVAYLKRPVRCKGQSGIFMVTVNPSVLPDVWTTDSTER